jgi:PTH1 family peptidyl-tRNA hydrolase
MKLIVGLGNPDAKYQLTRHNAGFMAVDKLAELKNLEWRFNKTFNAQIAKGLDCYLVKPMTYMNNSGEAVQKIMTYYDLLPLNSKNKVEAKADLTASLTVLCDDLDIKLGAYKIATTGSAAGHNGVQSIINQLNTPNFTRIRLGVATEKLDKCRHSIFPNSVARFVLKKFPASEKKLLDQAIDKALENI